jgi:hypothetical protein
VTSQATDDGQAAQELADAIAKALNEPNIALLRIVIDAIGPEQAQTHLAATLEVEAAGGMMTADGSRRRTPGGVFFLLARKAMPGPLRRKIWPVGRKPQRDDQSNGPAQTQANPTPAPLPTLTWEDAKQLISQAVQSIGEARTVKITLVGRPGRVVEQTNCVVVAMKGKEPPSLPKGLPTPPANSAITWAVFIATKQWAKVKDSLQKNGEDQLIIEGYPLIDPKSKASVVLALSVKSVAQERAQREAKKDK